MRYLLAFLVGALAIAADAAADSFSTGASTNVVPGNLNITGALTVWGTAVSTNAATSSNWSASGTTNSTLSGTASAFSISLNSNANLLGEAANTLARRNGTSAQVDRIYDTFTDTSNYRYGALGFQKNANALTLETEVAGTSVGTGGSIYIAPLGVNKWQVDTNGTLLAVTDNTFDIGASGATRPRNIYAASGIYLSSNGSFLTTGLNIPSGAGISWSGNKNTIYGGGTDGIVLIENWAGNDFNRLQLGGTTASFPSLKRSTTGIVARLADDSADTWIEVSQVRFGTNILSFSGTNMTFNGGTVQVTYP